MGKSAKFHKRPNRKEKESKALNKIVDPISSVTKKSKQHTEKKKEAFTAAVAAMDVDVPAKKIKKKSEDDSKPDYVDLLSGKKTYKKIPVKRRS